jgi:hypothetical protein
MPVAVAITVVVAVIIRIAVSIVVTLVDVVTVGVTSCSSSMVHYPSLVMHLSCASFVVLISCLPLLGFEKKKR